MNFDYKGKTCRRLLAFMDEHIYPNEGRFAEIAANRARAMPGTHHPH